jgi:hypothetical protein
VPNGADAICPARDGHGEGGELRVRQRRPRHSEVGALAV